MPDRKEWPEFIAILEVKQQNSDTEREGREPVDHVYTIQVSKLRERATIY